MAMVNVQVTEAEWVAIDRELRRGMTERAALDAREMHLLREAERVQIWKPLGMVSMLDYMDRVLRWRPETARKRLRVARALGSLPELSAALESGELSFCDVRELIRVATTATERAWIDATRSRTSREIEDMVNGRRPGDLPDDPADPEAMTHVVRFELDAPAFALLRETRLALETEHGKRLEDSELFELMCNAVRDGEGGERADGRAKFQIAYTVCERCEQGWQTGAGAKIPVDDAAVERAQCDAQHIGSIDGDAPERAHQDVPPSVVRFIWARDHGGCQTPGCRSTRGLEIHHIVHRKHGGTHEASNLTLRCSACHTAHHKGLITITGTAPDQIVTTRNVVGPPPRAHHRPPTGGVLDPRRADAIEALVTMRWKRATATAAVDQALGHVAHDAPLAELIREALRRGQRPASR